MSGSRSGRDICIDYRPPVEWWHCLPTAHNTILFPSLCDLFILDEHADAAGIDHSINVDPRMSEHK